MRAFVVLAGLMAVAPPAFANTVPQGQPDRYVLRQGESIDVRPPGVLGNDTDGDGDSLFLEPAGEASSGQLILFPDGSFSYTPDARFTGADRFTYRACDGLVCSAPVEVRIESDGIAAPLAARPDRFEIVAGSAAVELDVLANDAFAIERLSGGRLDLRTAASLGDVEVRVEGHAPTGFRYRPRAESVGTDRFRYRLCELAGRCVESEVEVVILPIAPLRLDVSGGAGFADVALRGLPELPAPNLVITGTGKVSHYAFPISIDATPLDPWAGGGAAQTLFTAEGGESGRQLRLRVTLESTEADVDLYVGTDDNTNRRASSDELTCTAASVASVESCVLELDIPADERRSWWAYAHNREGRRVEARLRVLEVDRADPAPFAWSAPGRLEAGGSSALRLSWADQTLLPGETAEGWVQVESESGTALGWVPYALVAEGREVAPRLLRDGDTVRFDLPGGSAATALVLDVPEGTASFTVSAVADSDFGLALFRAPSPDDQRTEVRVDGIADGRTPDASQRSEDGVASIEVIDAPAGRWLVRVGDASGDLAEVAVDVAMEAEAAPAARLGPGLYAPVRRPGEGLIVDRTGSDWSGVWYAFDDAGRSTWLYLQGAAPADGHAWTPTVYRSAVGAGGQRLATIGRASLSRVDDGGPVFSFEIDGRVGSQRLLDFGRECPVDRGTPRDLSGLWYDPARSGEGYGVWITPGYEFYGLFAHDARGQPRYLSAEGQGFAILGDRELALTAYRGACLFCSAGTRTGEAVGDFRRSFAPSLSPILTTVEATFGSGLTGVISRRETLERLGGDAAGFGCAAP